MIRKTLLKCSKCGEIFLPQKELYYRDTFNAQSLTDYELICDNCIKEWEKKWDIKTATFVEKDLSLYVTIELKNGEIFNEIDCTPVEDIIITSLEIPTSAKKTLFAIFSLWDLKRKENKLKSYSFNDEFMKTTFSCETYGGIKFSKIAFRFNSKGHIETEIKIPKYILDQILEVWEIYQRQIRG